MFLPQFGCEWTGSLLDELDLNTLLGWVGAVGEPSMYTNGV